jgi:hypothetical protein
MHPQVLHLTNRSAFWPHEYPFLSCAAPTMRTVDAL